MKISFKKINIEAPFPTTQCGHSCQTYLVNEFKDHLYCRAVGIIDEDKWIIHLSLDLLALNLEFRSNLQQEVRKQLHNENIQLITSATHTHYANSIREDKYKDWLKQVLVDEIKTMEYKEYSNVEVSYQRVPCQVVGKSRISGYETNNEMLSLVRLYSNGEDFLNIVIHNCHPTILEAHTKFFSAEYVGVTLKNLEEKHHNINFTYLQGASGDISSRFVRKGQEYQDVLDAGERLANEVEKLLTIKVEKKPLNINYSEIQFETKFDLTPIDTSKLRSDLSPRELETIKIGAKEREKLLNKQSDIFSEPPTSFPIGILDMSALKIIFFANEIFSEYMNYVDLDKAMLVSYSNGYGTYVLPIDFPYVTYEMFTDTLSKESKLKLIEILKSVK